MILHASNELVWACIAAAVLGGAAGLAAGHRGRLVARWLGRLTALVLVLVWVGRWVEAGHLPLFGMYEGALSLASVTALVAVLWDLRAPDAPVLLLPVAGLAAAALLAQGMGFDAATYALTISERSLVVDVHAALAWSAFGVLSVNVAASISVAVARVPSERATSYLERSLHWGFVLHSAMMAAGSFYAFLLFGKAWSSDPMEVMGLVVWLAYGTLLHLHLFAGWRARKLAVGCFAVFLLLIVSYRAIAYFPAWSSYHILDIGLREHIGG